MAAAKSATEGTSYRPGSQIVLTLLRFPPRRHVCLQLFAVHLDTVRGAVVIRPIWIVLAVLWAALLFGAYVYAAAKLNFGQIELWKVAGRLRL